MSKIFLFLFFTIYIISTPLNAKEIPKLASKLGLYGGMKASVQWERIFSSEKRMKKYKLDTLSQDIQEALKIYLIEHAADSEQPIVPGL